MNHPTLTELRHAINEGDTAAAMEYIARLERELAPRAERQVLYARDALEMCFDAFLSNDLSGLDGEPTDEQMQRLFVFVRDLRSIFRALEGQLLRTDSLIVGPHQAVYVPTITFRDDGTDRAMQIMGAVVGYTVDLTIPDNTGYPAERVYIERIDDDGDVVVRETTESGAPVLQGGTWAVPINRIAKVTVL